MTEPTDRERRARDLAHEEPRWACPTCRRPQGLCYCAHVTPTRTRTRVVVLQHPREARVPLGTLHMVRLVLPEATLLRGVDFTDDPVVEALCAAQPAPCLLFPGPDARDLAQLSPEQARVLIAVDGTWAQAKAVLRRNPQLAALPRVTLPPGSPSAYRIRRQPAAHCVSTLEALARALDLLEGPPGHFERILLRPLHALVDDQLRFPAEQRTYRTRRHRRRDPQAPPHSLARVRALGERLVCVQGEANAWPAGHPDARDPELIQWRACRPATGASFQATLRLRGPLGPDTLRHTGLTAEALAAWIGWDELVERWRAFSRPDDVLAVWGEFFTRLAELEGLPLPGERLDLRLASRELSPGSGGLDACAARLGVTASPAAPGRCAHRLAELVAVVRELQR